ncbi:MAG: glycine betaine ABC transporter substrate-binding protein [Alkalibacterium sp.]|uniref:Glycine betaine/proline transport system substrate-binding protein n=1 Tax=Alkalibacterium gilvum TaxID=1130080 RepID=A0A1H6TNQ6_9LACT|nr:glycine betaine ABC transporter substrate-binding protein [Alkalibacterium sp.]SEI78807.1 glycine betaine/proline transport system substrate-binding protein [Alkalibacterium gilvum]MDN6293271.1 glycine betaine ABC transporter substrate-binding protein [Alkalibacterium sp.]MDN6295033.1 glycine betaine ABC transporter substrate-binding protein [Alkalibacterium sp.]MDN6326826.1 glycine betaine ABC transporter substrate-binding protein [Alkalibacterium sp.]
MTNNTWKKLGLTVMSASALFLAACSDDSNDSDDSAEGTVDGEIELAYVSWDSEIASTNVIGQVLEDVGYDVKLTALDNAIMWEAVANDEADAMVSAWLPGTHAPQFENYSDQMEHLGPNLEGAKIGLVVPEYMDVDSIEDLSDEADMAITGIEPGAGVVAATETALEEYENLSDWEVKTSSSGAMVTQLKDAYENEEEIIVTGWSPHWKFQSYDLKYLDDSKEVFGGEETIDTFVREDLEDDMSEAYQILDNFYWEASDMESVMLEIQDGTDPEEAAENWINDNQDKVAEWTDGVIEE